MKLHYSPLVSWPWSARVMMKGRQCHINGEGLVGCFGGRWRACAGNDVSNGGKAPSGHIANRGKTEKWPEKPHELNEYQEAEGAVLQPLIDNVRVKLRSMNDGEISASAYDTAWVAMVPQPDGGEGPQFPATVRWIVSNQLPDGSWGDSALFSAYDRMINTLACVVALTKWSLEPEICNTALSFLHENMWRLEEEEQESMPIGFEIAFPSLLQTARSLGIDFPYDHTALQSIYANREIKLKRKSKGLEVQIHVSVPYRSQLHDLMEHREGGTYLPEVSIWNPLKEFSSSATFVLLRNDNEAWLATIIRFFKAVLLEWISAGEFLRNNEAEKEMRREVDRKIPKDMMHRVPTSILFSLEGMPDLDWGKLLKLQSSNGSFLYSPSATAYALMQTGDKKCFDYIDWIVKKFNGGVPNVYPVDLFEHVWAVDRLERLGISRYFQREIKQCMEYVNRHWMEKGIGWARNCNVPDVDCTAMAFRVLRLHGYDVSPSK
ncbi:hypothetical protein EJB05_26281, partial [Eragrostis curvula]